MVKKTFAAKGIDYASELALKNISDLAKIIDWNIKHNVKFYRMSSEMLPWMSEYEIHDLPDINSIQAILKRIGEKAAEHDLRLTFHPGPFNVLATSNEKTLSNTLKDLRQHAEIMELMNLPRTPFAKINIHVGAAYGDKSAAIAKFCENFELLDPIVKSRLTVENDDKANMYAVKDLLEIHNAIGIPIVFDYLHHQFCTGGLSEEEAFHAAVSTWPMHITPAVHYSSSKKQFEDKTAVAPAHADYIYQHVKRYGKDIDIMFEAKAKELAVFRYLSEYKIKAA